MSKDNTQIKKFSGEGFHTWQVLVKYKMMSKGFWPLISGTKIIDRAKAEDVEDDERAQAIIMLHLDEALIHHVDQLPTAKEKWDELDKLYGASGKNSKISLKIEFFSLELKEGDAIGAFISHMKGLMAQLASVNARMDEDDAVAVLLKAVKKVYPTLVTTLKNIPNPTLEGVIQSCLDEEKRPKGAAESSNATTSSTNEQALSHQVVKIKCAHCKKVGHLASNCWIKYPNKMKCNKCKQTGHITSKCPNKESEANFVTASTSSEKMF